MIVVCPACQARFQYDESRFGHLPSKRFKCPKCSDVFEVANPAMGAVPAPPRRSEPTLSKPILPSFPAAENAAPLTHAKTTAKRDREAMLVAAGLAVPGMPPGLRYSLAFLTGPHASTVQVLEQPRIMIGREDGDIITRDPETSRQHAVIEIHRDGTAWLTDQNSTNGTVVNGENITDTVQLSSQQEFTCGNSTFMLLIRSIDDYTHQ